MKNRDTKKQERELTTAPTKKRSMKKFTPKKSPNRKRKRRRYRSVKKRLNDDDYKVGNV